MGSKRWTARAAVVAVVASMAVVGSGPEAGAAAGDPEPTFGGGDGVATFDLGETNGFFLPRWVHELADGDLLVAGETEHGGRAITRRNSDGTLDTAYGDEGYAALPDGLTATIDYAVGPDGAVTGIGLPISGQSNGPAVVFRFTAAGDPDTTFSGDGVLSVGSSGMSDVGIVVQSDGKPVIAVGNFQDAELRRLTTAGDADATFSDDGVLPLALASASRLALAPDGTFYVASNAIEAIAHISSTGVAGNPIFLDSIAFDVAVDSAGRILVVRNPSGSPVVERRLANGSVDTDFDGDGVAALPATGFASPSGLRVGLADAVWAGVSSGSGYVIHKLTSGGVPDASFSGDGRLDADDFALNSIAPTAAGGVAVGTFFDPSLEKYTSAGVLDATFGGDGEVLELGALRGTYDFGRAVAVQPDGKIVAAAIRESDMAVIRTSAAGVLDGGFGVGGIADVAALSGLDSRIINDLALDSLGRIVLSGGGSNEFDPTPAFLVRLIPSGQLDTTFGGGDGIVEAADIGDFASVVVASSNRVVAIGSRPADGDVVVARFTSAGVPDTIFDGDGRRVFGAVNGVAIDATLRADGAIYATFLDRPNGAGRPVSRVAALTVAGANLPGWGTAGLATVPPNVSNAVFAAGGLSVDPNGSVVVVGERCVDPAGGCNSVRMLTSRLLPNGAVNTSFGVSGYVTANFGHLLLEVFDVVRQPTGEVLVGYTLDPAGGERRVLRVLPAGELDPSWHNDGIAKVPNLDAGSVRLAQTADGDVVAVGTHIATSGEGDLLVARLQNPQPAPAKGGSVAVPPVRLLDTRNPGEGPCVSGANGRTLTVTGVGGVPPTASSVTLNVTVTAPTGNGFLTVWPTGQPRPTASNLNFVTGQTIPNVVIAKVGSGGRISVFANAGCPHVVVDVVGWTAGGAPPAAGGLTGLTPARLLDTRQAGKGPCLSGAGRTLKVTGVGGVPATGVGAVALNVTAVAPTGDGFITVWPTGQARPLASNLNFTTGQVIPNTVIARVGTGGQINLFASAGCPHVVVDVVGWYSSGAPAAGGYAGLTPARLLDTRQSGGCLFFAATGLKVTGVGGVPPSGVDAVALNVTVTAPQGHGHLTVWPAGPSLPPPTSNLNFVAGQTVANTVIVKVGTGDLIGIFANAGCPHVIVDVVGWFAAVPTT